MWVVSHYTSCSSTILVRDWLPSTKKYSHKWWTYIINFAKWCIISCGGDIKYPVSFMSRGLCIALKILLFCKLTNSAIKLFETSLKLESFKIYESSCPCYSCKYPVVWNHAMGVESILTQRKSTHFLENIITQINSSFPVLFYHSQRLKFLYKIIAIVSRRGRNDSS